MSGRRLLIKGYFAALRLIETQTASVGCAGGPVKGEVPGESVLRQPIDCVGVPQLIVRKSADNRKRGSLASVIGGKRLASLLATLSVEHAPPRLSDVQK
jgi:hypothetical protein